MFEAERSSYLQLVLDNTPDGITVQRPDGSLLYANAAAARLVGFDSPQELVNTPVTQVISRFEMSDEDGNPFPLERLPGRMALMGEQPGEALIRFRHVDDDTVRWSIVGARPVFDEDGTLLFVVNTFRYVTDYMRALQAERESRQRAQEAERRLSFLAQSSEILGQSLDYDATLRRVSQLAVPDIADWCAVDLYLDKKLQRVSVAHVDPAKVALAYDMHRRYPPREDAETGLYHVLRTGEPAYYPELTEELLAQAATDEEQLRLARELNLRSVLIVPLKARDHVLGAITLVGAESGRLFTEQDLALAEELARRAAQAVDNARLYREAQRTNEQLEERVARRTAALRETNQRLQGKIEEVQQGERRFRALLESAPDAMVIVDKDGRVRLVNTQAEMLFGYERQEMVGAPVEMLMPVNLRDLHVGHREMYAQQPRARPMGAGLRLAARRKDGSEIPVEISLSPLTDEGETLYIAAVRDVSERRRAEAQLRRSEMQLAEAQAIAHLGSWEWDVEHDRFAWSREMYRVLDLDPQEVSPSYDHFVARAHPKDRSRLVEAIRAARERGIPFSLHHRLVLEGGAVRTVHAQGTIETDDQGRVLRIVGTSQDVTMQKEIEEELRRSEALYRAMAENLPNGAVLVVDTDLRYRLARGPALDVNEEVITWEGKTVAQVARDSDWRERVEARYRSALAGQSTSEEIHRDGRVYLVQTVPLSNSAGDVYAALTLVQNVTEQREAEDTTRRLLELSRDLSATLNIDRLIKTVASAAVQLVRADSGRVHLVGRESLEGGASAVGAGGTANGETDTSIDASTVTPVLRTPIVNPNGQTIGTLEVRRNSAADEFTATGREKLEGLAQIAAIALQNALSFQRLRQLSQKLVSAQEEERRFLSRELHDSTGQILMALRMSLSMLREEMTAETGDSIVEQLEEVGEMVDAVYEEIRAVSHALRPPSLDVTSIDEALHGLCQDYARHSGLRIEYNGCQAPHLPDNVSISLYRLLQEALTNVAKHAQASKVVVALSNGNDEIELSVQDDGVGFSVTDLLQQPARGVGLLGLRERFELLGGSVVVDSKPGNGTRIAGAFRTAKVQ